MTNCNIKKDINEVQDSASDENAGTKTVFMSKEGYTKKKKGANILLLQDNTLPMYE